MVNQTQQYLTWADPIISKSMDKSKALVAIWIGINDVPDAVQLNVSLPEVYDTIVTAIFEESVQWLYDANFRNFVLLNLPPRDRSPDTLSKNTTAEVKGQTDSWNESLDKHAAQFSIGHTDANVMLYDANTFLNHVLDNASNYGFVNTKGFCDGYESATVLKSPELFGCTALDTYFWLNTGHITSRVHEILADDLDGFLRAQSK